MEKYQVMTSAFRQPGSWKWKHPRANVAIVKVNIIECLRRGIDGPKQIHPRHKTIEKIIDHSEGLYNGSTDRCQFNKELYKLMNKAEELNNKYNYTKEEIAAKTARLLETN